MTIVLRFFNTSSKSYQRNHEIQEVQEITSNPLNSMYVCMYIFTNSHPI